MMGSEGRKGGQMGFGGGKEHGGVGEGVQRGQMGVGGEEGWGAMGDRGVREAHGASLPHKWGVGRGLKGEGAEPSAAPPPTPCTAV